jgi:hypothetical protein
MSILKVLILFGFILPALQIAIVFSVACSSLFIRCIFNGLFVGKI